jgi:hypothetical protein
MAVIAILASLIFPVLARSKLKAYQVKCMNGLRQLGLAAMMYWDDNEGRTFRYRGAAKENGDIYWFGWIERGAEGKRRFDPEEGALYPYLKGRGVQVCPAFNYNFARYKLKATDASYGYGYNFYLSAPLSKPAVDTRALRRPGRTVLFADCAQVNTFQAPASPSNPMIEEFYYVNTNEATAHFRHGQVAQLVICDGHVESARMKKDTLDGRLPEVKVAQLPDEFFE